MIVLADAVVSSGEQEAPAGYSLHVRKQGSLQSDQEQPKHKDAGQAVL